MVFIAENTEDALEPYMSRRTVALHWGKHHRDYVEGLNKQLASSPLFGYTLEDLIKEGHNNGNPLPEYNNAAQVWNEPSLLLGINATRRWRLTIRLKRILARLLISGKTLFPKPYNYWGLVGFGLS